MGKKKITIVILLVASILITIFYFFLLNGKDENNTNTNTVNLTIGYSRLRISLPIFVAQEKGIFEKYGIKANLVMYDTAQPLMQALVEGKINIAGYTALPITLNGMIRSGTKLYFVTAMVEDQKHRISYLLRKKTKPGEKPKIKSIKDLRGKKIGILPTIAYKAWIEEILKLNGISPSEVVIQPIEPLLEPKALATGGVDALFTNDPAATAALAEGVAEFITNFVEVPKYFGEPFPFGSFNVRKKWADAHPIKFRKLIRALNEAVEFVNSHPKEAKQCMEPYLPSLFKPHIKLYPDAYYLPTYRVKEKMFQKIADKYFELKIIPKPISLQGLIINK